MFVAFKNTAKLSKYTHVPARLTQLRAAKTHLAKQYWSIYDDFVTYNKSVDKVVFNRLVKEINEIEVEIDKLSDMLRHPSTTQEVQTEDKHKHTKSPKEFARDFAAKRSEVKEDISDWKSYWVKVDEGDPYSKVEVEIVKAPTPPKKKPAPKKFTKQTTEVITSNIKDLLSNFAFKSKTECVSKQRTKPYYASKEEILEKIESNPDIKKLMPANYKKLTKDKLCEVFFSSVQ